MWGSNLLKSKHKPQANPIKVLSSSFLPTNLSKMTSSGSNLFFIKIQFITLPSEEME